MLERLRLSRMLDTLPERLVLARQPEIPAQDFLLLVLGDEAARRDSASASIRAAKARLDPTMRLELRDPSAKLTHDATRLDELCSLRFVETHAHGAIVGPVDVGQPFVAHALGHIACRRGLSVLALRTDTMLETLRHARLDNRHEAELRTLIGVDLGFVGVGTGFRRRHEGSSRRPHVGSPSAVLAVCAVSSARAARGPRQRRARCRTCCAEAR